MASSSNRRIRRTPSRPRCVGCGELVASPAVVRCGFCSRHHELTNRKQV
jgi:hypothetical protein